jgi:uncharacterized protein
MLLRSDGEIRSFVHPLALAVLKNQTLNIKSMKRYLGVIFLCFAFTRSAVAEPATRKSIEKLMLITNVAGRMDSQYASMLPMMTEIFKKLTPPGLSNTETTEAFNVMLQKMVTLFRAEMGWSTFKEDYIKLYASTMTQTEISDLIKFYESPSGKSYLTKVPMLTQKSTEIAQTKIEVLYPKIQQMIKDSIEETRVKHAGTNK